MHRNHLDDLLKCSFWLHPFGDPGLLRLERELSDFDEGIPEDILMLILGDQRPEKYGT